tara:strand:- start:12552 stop:14591 length:2040 start_codon:yes stop_codon:yes gene_type:complete
MTNYSLVKTANSAKASLAGGISANQGTLSLLGGEGGKFPALNANEYFYITVTSAALATNTEIMRVTARNADTLTIKQADGSARNLNNTFSAGDSVEIRTTNNAISDLFDLDNILPTIPAQPDKFKFRANPGGGTRYIGPTGSVNSSLEDEDVSFAVRSDGTNATYSLLNPDDISNDNNTSTGFFDIPVRGHYDISHLRSNTFLKFLNASTGVNASGGYGMQTTSSNTSLYAHAEGHNIAIQEGSLAYLANVSENNSQYGAYGEWAAADSDGAVNNSNTLAIDNTRRCTSIAGTSTSDDLAQAPQATAQQWIGKFLFPPATRAGNVNIPPGTYVTGCQIGTFYSVTLTLNNNITVPDNTRIQFYTSRVTQLGEEYSASRYDGVYYKREITAPAIRTMNGESGILNAKEDAYMPVAGQIANVYVVGTTNNFSSQRYTEQLDTNLASDTAGGNHDILRIKCKPLSVNSVFTIRYAGTKYAGGNGIISVVMDFMTADPQPTNNRVFKNPNDNTVAKAVVNVGHYMFNDQYVQPEFNLPASVADNYNVSAFSNGRVTAGTWPNNINSVSQQPQSNNPTAYFSGNTDNTDFNTANGPYSPDWFTASAHVFSGPSAAVFIRPGVTDFVRFRTIVLRETTSGTTSYPYGSEGTMYMIVEEHVQPEGCFGFDIPGGLDTTAHWNGNLV